jgi:hypothetical protein
MARRHDAFCLLLATIAVAACSGGGGGGSAPPPVTPPATTGAVVTVSGASPFPAACGGTGGTVYVNAEVEPSLAVNPANPANLLAMWQQDRWSNGSARGLVSAVSLDGGATWSARPMAFSRCGGGTPANGGDFERATDPWVAFGPDGSAWAMSLSTTGSSPNAMLVARSLDGGRTWGNATALIADAAPFFNDKNALTADPFDARYAYAVWDRLTGQGTGPAMFARTVDAGASWEPARVLYDPGAAAQTIGNLVVVLTDGTLVNLATRLGTRADAPRNGAIVALRSGDRGATWGPPVTVASQLSVGARDPETGAVIRDGGILLAAAAGPGRSVHVVWQDARFSGGARDGIAYSRSADGGLTWSAPVRVNPDGAVDAFTPGVSVLADGTVGVTYYDLRDNTADPATLPAGYWLARSTDGSTWTETRLAGPFDLALAPNAGGLFLGDYMGLAGSGSAFLALFARTTGDLANRTEIAFVRASAPAAALDKATGAWPERWVAQEAAAFEVDAAWAWRVDAAIGRALEARRRPVPR